MDKNNKIAGVFETEQEAIRAIEALKRQGYKADEISVVGKNKDKIEDITDTTHTRAPEGAAAGAATGGLLGGTAGVLAGLGLLAIPGIGPILAAGPIAAGLTGAAAGAGAGTLVGGLIGLGIHEDDAKRYGDYVKEGKILVLVDSDADREEGVYDTFRENRSLNADMYGPTMYGVNSSDAYHREWSSSDRL